jgi:uroporphyrinogen-III synthase
MPELPQKGPLSGQTVLVTRAASQCEELTQKLENAGAMVLAHPVIRIEPPTDMARLDNCLARIADFSLLIFLSSNAVRSFTSRVNQRQFDDSRSSFIAAIGKGTSAALQRAGFSVSFSPEHSNSESMADATIEFANHHQLTKPVLILRADRGSDVLPSRLSDAGVAFEQVAMYRSVDVTEAESGILQRFATGDINWVTLTSSAIAGNVATLFGDLIRSQGVKLVSISPATTAAAIQSGLKVHAEAEPYNTDGLVDAIREHVARNS